MTRLSEQEALSLLIEMVEEDHAVYASGADAVARWKRLRAIVLGAAAAEERGRRSGVEEAAKLIEQLRAESRGTVIAPYAAARIRALAPRDSAPICDNCKRAAAAKNGRTEHGIEIGPCYCVTLRAPRRLREGAAMSTLVYGGTIATTEEADAVLRILFADGVGDSIRALRAYGDLRVAAVAELLGEARAWIDKHKCCTEERRELVARIDEARK